MDGNFVPCSSYYSQYHGHDEKYLRILLNKLREGNRNCVFLAGDSSLDNKYWLNGMFEAVNRYQHVLNPPRMKADVNYWLNYLLEERGRGDKYFALNTAVEATTLYQRQDGWIYSGGILEQDKIIAENITEDDYLIVSLGGNDIVLAPTVKTVASLTALVHWSGTKAVKEGNGWGMSHFKSMYQTDLGNYIKKLVGKRKPKKILVCMIYYPSEQGQGWADQALSMLKYDSDPSKVQAAISAVFEHAVKHIKIEGTEVVPVPLFEVLDGSNPDDYVARVEPSDLGSRKMAAFFLDKLFGDSAASAM